MDASWVTGRARGGGSFRQVPLTKRVRRGRASPDRAAGPPGAGADEVGAGPGVYLDEKGREHEGDRGQELHEDVQARAGGVLERVADRVAHDRRGVRRSALADDVAGSVLQVIQFDELLRVV